MNKPSGRFCSQHDDMDYFLDILAGTGMLMKRNGSFLCQPKECITTKSRSAPRRNVARSR